MTTPTMLCTICAEAVEPHTEMYCSLCGNLFHLNQRTDIPGRDCGDAWINGESLALEFGCQSCLDGPAVEDTTPGGALADIVDAAEAAAWLGMPEPDLIVVAESGRVPHRKTVGGVYLFERDALAAFRESTR